MAHFNKIGLLILNENQSKFLVCEKDHFTSDFLLPGGKIEPPETEEACIIREIREELDVEVNINSLTFLAEYHGPAAGDPTKDVSIKLYQGGIIGTPKPSNEIVRLHWIGKGDAKNHRVSPIIREQILPDLLKKRILK